MGWKRGFLYFIFALCGFTAPAFGDTFRFNGSAEDSRGNLLYTEQHTVNGSCTNGVFRPRDHQVHYVQQTDNATSTFARKDLDYSTSPIRPSVSFRQGNFDETLEITYPNAGTAAVLWQTPKGDTEKSQVEVSKNLVVDAGFDNLVRQNWSKVVKGESVRFRFLAPTRGTDYAFILEPAENTSLDTEYLVQIRPDSLVLNLLVDPIVLGYNQQGALVAYSGLTNVRENPDQNYTATIRYTVSRYPECDLTP